MTHPPLKVKAPFLLTQMNHMSQPTWICVWSRRGRQWVVSQDLLLDATGKCPPRDCKRYWLTFNQAAKLGGHVRKGERSSLVTFWHIGEEKIIRDSDGNQRKSKPFLLRFYHVFNVEQTEGIGVVQAVYGYSGDASTRPIQFPRRVLQHTFP